MNDTTVWGIAVSVIVPAVGWIIKQNYQINKKIVKQGEDINEKIVKILKKVCRMDHKKVSHKVCLRRRAAGQCTLNNDETQNKKMNKKGKL